MKKLLGLSLSLALLAMAVSPAFAQTQAPQASLNVSGVYTLAGTGAYTAGLHFNGVANADTVLETRATAESGTANGGTALAIANDYITATSTKGDTGWKVTMNTTDLSTAGDLVNYAFQDVADATGNTLQSVPQGVAGAGTARASAPATAVGNGCAIGANAAIQADDLTFAAATDFISDAGGAAGADVLAFSWAEDNAVIADGCSSFSYRVLPILDLTPSAAGIANGVYTGTLTFTISNS